MTTKHLLKGFKWFKSHDDVSFGSMTKRDEEDLGLALISGGIGATLGYGKAQSKIQSLEAEKRGLQNEIFMLRNTLSAQENLIAKLQAENNKLKEEPKKGNTIKSITRSLFDKI